MQFIGSSPAAIYSHLAELVGITYDPAAIAKLAKTGRLEPLFDNDGLSATSVVPGNWLSLTAIMAAITATGKLTSDDTGAVLELLGSSRTHSKRKQLKPGGIQCMPVNTTPPFPVVSGRPPSGTHWLVAGAVKLAPGDSIVIPCFEIDPINHMSSSTQPLDVSANTISRYIEQSKTWSMGLSASASLLFGTSQQVVLLRMPTALSAECGWCFSCSSHPSCSQSACQPSQLLRHWLPSTATSRASGH